MLRLLILTALTTIATAIPRVALPFNAQVPLVARVGESYNFALSPETFSSTGSITYKLQGAPAWLSINSANGVLSGKPGNSDAGVANFTIIGSDNSGSANSLATLVISAGQPPQLTSPLTSELAKIGNLTGPTTLQFNTGTPISFEFSSTLFEYANIPLYHYATLSDHNPLPAWLSFNNLRFSGVAPTNQKFPMRVDLLLTTSEIEGFASIVSAFSVVVSSHRLMFRDTDQAYTFNTSQNVNVANLRNNLYLDGAKAAATDITFATANTTDWLKFDNQTLSLSGTPPSRNGSVSEFVMVAATDKYGDIATTLIRIHLTDSLFTGDLPSFNATIGQPVNYAISRDILASPSLKVSADLGSASSYLSFNANNLQITGTVPNDTSAGIVDGKITLSTADGSDTESRDFGIQLLKAVISPTTSTSSSTTPTSTSDSPQVGSDIGSNRKLSLGAIAGLVIGLILLLIILLILVWFFRRRASQEKRSRGRSVEKDDIGRPTTADGDGSHWAHNTYEGSPIAEKGISIRHDSPISSPERLSPPPPVMTTRSSGRTSFPVLRALARKKSNSNLRGSDHPVSVSMSYPVNAFAEFESNRTPSHESRRIQSAALAGQVIRDPQNQDHPANRASAGSQTSPRNSNRANMGLPVSKRMTGLGHGASPPTRTRSSIIAVAARNSTSNSSGNRTSSGADGRSIENGPPTPRRGRGVSQNSSTTPSTGRSSGSIHTHYRPVSRRTESRSPFFAGGTRLQGKRFSGSIGSGSQATHAFGLATIVASPNPETDDANRISMGKPLHVRQQSSLSLSQWPSPYRNVFKRRNTQKSQTTWRTVGSSSDDTNGSGDIFSPNYSIVRPDTSSHSRNRSAVSVAPSHKRGHSRSTSAIQRMSARMRMNRPTSAISKATTSGVSESIDFEDDDFDDVQYESMQYSYKGRAKAVVLERSNSHLFPIKNEPDSPTRGWYGHRRWRSKSKSRDNSYTSSPAVSRGNATITSTAAGPATSSPKMYTVSNQSALGRLFVPKRRQPTLPMTHQQQQAQLQHLQPSFDYARSAGNFGRPALTPMNSSTIMNRTRNHFRPYVNDSYTVDSMLGSPHASSLLQRRLTAEAIIQQQSSVRSHRASKGHVDNASDDLEEWLDEEDDGIVDLDSFDDENDEDVFVDKELTPSPLFSGSVENLEQRRSRAHSHALRDASAGAESSALGNECFI